MRRRRSNRRSRYAAKPAALRPVLGLLLLLQVVAGFGASILYEWTAAAVLVSLAYLVLAWRLGRALADALPRRWLARAGALGIAVLWQVPALLGSINLFRELMGWTPYDGNSDLLDFAMETWQIALAPLLSLLPQDVRWWGFSPFYLGLCASAPVLVAGFTVAALWPTRLRRRSRIRPPLAETAAAMELAPASPAPEEPPTEAPPQVEPEPEPPAPPAAEQPAPPRAATVEPPPSDRRRSLLDRYEDEDRPDPAEPPVEIQPPPGGPGPWQPVRRWQDASGSKDGRRRPK